jgi:hypothetical protein
MIKEAKGKENQIRSRADREKAKQEKARQEIAKQETAKRESAKQKIARPEKLFKPLEERVSRYFEEFKRKRKDS